MSEQQRDDTDHDTEDGPTYAAEGVRQGAIVLRSRERRAIFIAGLVGVVALVLLFGLAL